MHRMVLWASGAHTPPQRSRAHVEDHFEHLTPDEEWEARRRFGLADRQRADDVQDAEPPQRNGGGGCLLALLAAGGLFVLVAC